MTGAGPAIPTADAGSADAGRSGAPAWEQAIFTLWIFVTFRQFPGDALLLYPMALYFTASTLIRAHEIVPIATRSLILFSVPVLAALSWGWSAAPSDALRFGLMMILTVLITVYVGARFTPNQVARSVYIAGAGLVVTLLPTMAAFGQGGAFDEKNIFANRMLFVLAASLAVAYNRDERLLLRLSALPFMLIAASFILTAGSATALVLGVGSITVMTMVWVFWSGLRNVQHARSLMVVFILVGAVMGGIVLANSDPGSIAGKALDALGKDSTLTGRTMLWEAAGRIVEEKPWFGVGAEGFWLWNRGDAATLLELSYKPAGTDFNFHNAYLETRVHLGLVGMGLFIATLAWCLFNTLTGWLRDQGIARSFLLLISVNMFTITFTESILFGPFDIAITLFYISAVTVVADRLHERQQAWMAAQAAAWPEENGLSWPQEPALR